MSRSRREVGKWADVEDWNKEDGALSVVLGIIHTRVAIVSQFERVKDVVFMFLGHRWIRSAVAGNSISIPFV